LTKWQIDKTASRQNSVAPKKPNLKVLNFVGINLGIMNEAVDFKSWTEEMPPLVHCISELKMAPSHSTKRH
jgi:hypothetical protein